MPDPPSIPRSDASLREREVLLVRHAPRPPACRPPCGQPVFAIVARTDQLGTVSR
jgi:hypothetical protein